MAYFSEGQGPITHDKGLLVPKLLHHLRPMADDGSTAPLPHPDLEHCDEENSETTGIIKINKHVIHKVFISMIIPIFYVFFFYF